MAAAGGPGAARLMATDPARVTTPERTIEDQDQALRPKTLDEFIGQRAARAREPGTPNDSLHMTKARRAPRGGMDHVCAFSAALGVRPQPGHASRTGAGHASVKE